MGGFNGGLWAWAACSCGVFGSGIAVEQEAEAVEVSAEFREAVKALVDRELVLRPGEVVGQEEGPHYYRLLEIEQALWEEYMRVAWAGNPRRRHLR